MPNIGLTLPQDYVVVVSRVALVPKAAANPDLGEAFLAFLMSRDGQTVLAERLRLPISIKSEVNDRLLAALDEAPTQAAIRARIDSVSGGDPAGRYLELLLPGGGS